MSSQPESMAEAATAGSTPLHRGLPEEIFIWEILVRLPPKALLRCRTVCRAWRRATFTRDFHLAHHARQPSLPLLYDYHRFCNDGESIDFIPFDHRAGFTAADQLQSVARFRCPNDHPERSASCEGLLLISFDDMHFTVCNPVTRQYAHLQQLDGFSLLGMYRHNPTGEYRVLLYWRPNLLDGEAQAGSYVFTLGSGNPPRHIGYPDAEELVHSLASVLFRGNLHWCIGGPRVMVFDTTTELFRQMQMPAPAAPGRTKLFEMDAMMGMSSSSEKETTIDIWVLQDYEAEVWTYKCHVELPVAELREQFEQFDVPWSVVVASCDGVVLLLVRFDGWLVHIDTNGKLVASFHRRGLYSTQLRIKQTLVSHTFFPTQDVNASPFI